MVHGFSFGMVLAVCLAHSTFGAVGADYIGCDASGALQSGSGNAPISLTVTNSGEIPVLLGWKDYDGNTVPVSDIGSGANAAFDTYATHAWVVSDRDGGCICAFVVADPLERLDVNGICRPSGAGTFEATASYERLTIEGWSVLVSAHYDDKPERRASVMAELSAQLATIAQVLPGAALRQLRDVQIWVEVEDSRFPGAAYHPSAGWLADNGMNPDKARGLQIAENLVTWRGEQPYMVLHELAHAYHDQILPGNADIVGAYAQARDSGRYDAVDHVAGGRQKAYAMNNEMEFFAELTEAWFGRNDYFPFDRDDLLAFDPVAAVMVEAAWAGSD